MNIFHEAAFGSNRVDVGQGFSLAKGQPDFSKGKSPFVGNDTFRLMHTLSACMYSGGEARLKPRPTSRQG
ncbi:MAG: hypothetical protein DWB56_00825 [Candidatus Jettenia sp.]|uniref:Uncharacterized protein n=1 Tax=Candidatus Jettenia caeni TaxID=247490 RepID=I3IJ68_9BACT|nr:hypothetical protein [Candidatus Jettenia sp.]GAB61763.1 hypothetical protein KSU1_C0167 [Candidatus Jettenia caeni]